MLAFQSNYKARCDDVILASSLKTGTTWLKALCACIMDYHDDQLSSKNPHLVVKTLEYEFAGETLNPDDLSGMPSPRLFHTHLPYSALPESIKNSECKIVYITRNPSDNMGSSFERLKNLEVNKNGELPFGNVPNRAFFRLGKVGDWENYFTAEMKQGLDGITRMKLEGSGLDFES
ncbi:hypothetical protein WN943_019021 [Citrus x changshan-huyou]